MLDRFSYSNLTILGEPTPLTPDKDMMSYILVPPPQDSLKLNPDLISLAANLNAVDLITRTGIVQSLKNNSPRNTWPYLNRAYSVVFTVKPRLLANDEIKDVVCVDAVIIDPDGEAHIHDPLTHVRNYAEEVKKGHLVLSSHLATLFEKNIGIALIDRFFGQNNYGKLNYQERLLIFTLLDHNILPVNADGIPIPKF